MPVFLENYGMEFFCENEDNYMGLMSLAAKEGKAIKGYYGLPYFNKHFGDAQIILRTANLDSYLTIDENPIRECLRDWATGSRLEITKERLYFYMQTNINQYMIVVRSDGDVYGSIKYSVFVENGVFVGNQYFRMRNYLDNRANICWWRCYLGQQYW